MPLGIMAVALSTIAAGIAGCTRANSPAQQEDVTMMTVTSKDGTSVAYRRSGAGPPLVLVHGTTADHTRWARVLPELEPHFTVYAMDRRGRGGSGDPTEYSIAREFDDVAAVVEAAGQPVFLLGHSYGAICSLEAALLTDRVRGLILYEPPIPLGAPLYPPGAPERIQALVDAGEPEAGLELFMREVVRMPEHELAVYRTLPQWNVRIALARTIPRELVIERDYSFDADRFAALRIPTLLLLGGDSPPIFRQATERIYAALPDSRIAVLPGQQHVAMDTAPELFLQEVMAFARMPQRK
jgi:pimeloyl-ACP methyl ester carboxylesterase